ncbi:MAG: 16S rRNA pseudouridine(516) synthase [Lachnospiraceae bacterium]|nr:16S rRNA pseudouridine(516) synthase [Lachnospiraceae bacterium]
MTIRLDKWICDNLNKTRKEAKDYIKVNNIVIDGLRIKDSDYKFDPYNCVIEINGKLITSKPEYTYIILNKPAGYVSANTDNVHKTVFELLPKEYKDYSIVGRLDIDTEGLMLITNDGALNHKITSPKHHFDKTYFIRTDSPCNEDDVKKVETGFDYGEEKPSLPGRLNILSTEENDCTAEITIREGKFHQVKKMMHTLGHEVIYLKRLSMGPIILPESLNIGEWRLLNEEEIKSIEEYNV